MDIVDPTVVLLLDPALQPLNGLDGLKAAADWQGQVVEGTWNDAAPAWSGVASSALPDVIVLDHCYLDSLCQWLQSLHCPLLPSLVVLLDTPEESLVAEALEAGAQDFLVRSQVHGSRLRCTLQNLWRQRQLRQQLEVCRQQSGQWAMGNESPRGTATHPGALGDDAEASPPHGIKYPNLQPEVLDPQVHLANILNHSSACICSLRLFPDLSWEYDYNSRGSETVYGYSPEFLTENPHFWASRVYPEDFEQVIKPALEGILAGESVHHVEFRFVHRNGAVRWISETCNAQWHEGQQCWVVTTVAVDISDYKTAEVALRQSEARLQVITDSIPGCISYVDAEQRYRFVNRTYEEWFNCQKADLLGRTVEEVVGPTAYRQAQPHIEAVLSGQTTTCEAKLTYGNGDSRFISGILVPDFDAAGIVEGYYALITDISDRKQTEHILQTTSAELDRFFSVALDPLCIANTDGYFLRLNPAWEETLGYSLKELKSNSFLDFVHPDDLDSTLAAMAQLADQQEILNFVNRYRHQDGSYRWIEWRSIPVGNLIYASARDITEQKQAEIALRASERRYSVLAENSPVGVFQTNQAGDCTYVNPKWCKLAGLTPEEAFGAGWTRALHPEDRELISRAWYGEKVQQAYVTFEFRFQKPDGQVHWLYVQAVPFLNGDNQSAGYMGTVTDITERKQAEAKIGEISQRLALATHAAQIGIWELDLIQDRIIWDDRTYAIYGVTPGDHDENFESWKRCLHPEDWLRVQPEVQAAIAGERDYHVEFRIIRPDGQIRFVEAHAVVTRNQAGVPQRLIGVNLDVTDRKQNELALQQLNEELEQRVYERTKALLESQTINRQILESIPDLLIWMTADGTCLKIAGGNNVMLIVPTSESINQNITDYLPPEVAELRMQFLGEALRTQEIQVYEQQVSYGTLIEYEEVRVVPVAKDRALVLIRNISDRKQAEVALRESEERLQLAQEAAQMGSWDWNILTNQVFWSESMEKLMGLEPGSFDGRFETISAMIHPDDWQRVIEAISRSIDHDEIYDIEFRFIKPDGSIRWAMSKARVLRNAEGRAIRMTGMDVDITHRKQAEVALRESEARFQQIASSINEIFWLVDPNLDILYVSPACEHIWGRPLQDLNTETWLAGIHPDDRSIILANHEVVFQSSPDQPYNGEIEYRILRPDGEVRWLRDRAFPIFDDQGQLQRIAGVAEDITERKQTAIELQKLAAVVENSPDMIGIATLQGETLYINTAGRQLLGRIEDSELIGKPITDYVSPAAIDQFEQEIIPIVRATGSWKGEIHLRHQQTAEEIVVEQALFLISDEQSNEPLFMATVIRDIRDRKQLEEEQSRLISILEASPDHIGMARPDGTVIWNNRQAKLLSGLPLNVDVTQIPVSAYHPPWALKLLQQESMPTAMRDGIWVGETALLNPQGGEIPVSQLILAHRSASGEVEYLSTIIRDISSLKQAEQALREANLELEARVAERTAELQQAKEAAESAYQAKSIFLANMSHELRTPLNAILGFSQLMARDRQLSATHQQELSIIHRSGEQLLTLINDILEMSKIEAGQVTLHPTSFNLNRFLEELTTMLRFRAEAKGLAFSVLYPADLEVIEADEQKLRQVIINLLDNAIKFTQSGAVVLRVYPLESPPAAPKPVSVPCKTLVRFEVEDTGCGIAPEDRDLIFAPFSQATVRDRPPEGTGLGLPISQNFVQLMGGKLQFATEPGQGTTFSFEIPVTVITRPIPHAGKPALRTIALAPNQPRPAILVVEDDEDNRFLLDNWLSQWGFTVRTADNGQEALQQWQQEPPDLIFMDLRMPVMDGQTAIRQIRQREQERRQLSLKTDLLPPTKIVVVSAGMLTYHSEQMVALGCNDFLPKPILEADLSQVLVRQLGVQFLYSSPDIDGQLPDQTETATTRLTTAALQTLPEDWLQRFHLALIRLDQDQMLSLAVDIAPEYGDLAAALNQAIYNFEYEKLLTLIEDIL